jgi:hypothetical protein
MKRNLTLLTILGALIALAVPASSMASIYPAGHKFEIAGNVNGPKFTTSLGACSLGKITGTIPAAPKNEEGGLFSITTPTVGTCSGGASLTVGGSWKFGAEGYLVTITGTTEPVVLRFASLPGCKLTSSALVLTSLWSNGTTTPTLLKSGFHAHSASAGGLTWANDGASCALAGKTEAYSWESATGIPGAGYGQSQTVTDLTSPTTPIIVGNNK